MNLYALWVVGMKWNLIAEALMAGRRSRSLGFLTVASRSEISVCVGGVGGV